MAVERRGLFSGDRYVVEFAAGLGSCTIRVGSGDIHVLASGGGAEGWPRRRELKRGVWLGAFLAFGLPALTSLAIYFARGGRLADLIAGLPGEVVSFAFDLVTRFGLVSVRMAVAALLVIRRRR